jgi:2',3'-cyclic-nucleotide 2'-phosphodiesterase (5'-nucleotidase family)
MAAFVTVPLPAQSEAEVSIIFMHDMHSHLDAERFIDANGKVGMRGGFAYMKTAIDNIKKRYPNSFLLDAGDFAMGTPYQTIFSAEAAELRLMGQIGFEATTLGNHEFDYRTQGLTEMFNTVIKSGDRLTPMLCANIDWDRTLADPKRVEKATALKETMERYGAKDYMIIEKGGVKAALFGILGIQADSYAPLSGLYFINPIKASKAVVAKIKKETDADMIICLSHSGTFDNPAESEDELLAKAVPEIDFIISGHTHTRLANPIIIGKTAIGSCGSYTYDVGHIKFVRDGSRYKVSGYELFPVTDALAKDPAVDAAVLKYRDLVNKLYFSHFGYRYDQRLASSSFSFEGVDTFGLVQGEEPLGNLITDAYIAAVKKAEGDNYRKVDVSVAPFGAIRGSFTEGVITVADAFNLSSLGIGPDRVPGYPLVSVYLTGKELKTAAEVDISVSTLMIEARLYMSGITYTYNPNRLLLNRVTDVRFMDPDGTTSEIDDNKLYRVIAGLYSCQMLGAVEAHSSGLLAITPKDENGNPIADFEQHLVYDGGVELKEWVAVAKYLESFPKVDGLPQIPESYSQLQGRKVEDNSKSLGALLKKPNKIFFMLVGGILLILIILAAIVYVVIRIIRKRGKAAPAAKPAVSRK